MRRGEQPKDSFEDNPEETLDRLVATQMPEDAPTENLRFGFACGGGSLYEFNTMETDFAIDVQDLWIFMEWSLS